MAENKKSVLLYCDIIHTIKSLTDEEAGKLFKHYLDFINDLNPTSDRLTELLFEPIKQNLKRDLKKWEVKSERNSTIAREGWVKRTHANACERMNGDAKHADKDKVTVTVTVTDTVTDTVKVKDIKVKEDKIEFISKVFLTQIEKEKILLDFGEDSDYALRKLSTYKNSSGKNYKSDYHALIGWVKDQVLKEKNSAKKDGNKTANTVSGINEVLNNRGINPNDYIQQPYTSRERDSGGMFGG